MNRTDELRRCPKLIRRWARGWDAPGLAEEITCEWWSEDDFASLFWPPDTSGHGTGPLVRLERRLQRRNVRNGVTIGLQDHINPIQFRNIWIVEFGK